MEGRDEHADDTIQALYRRYRAPLTSYVWHMVADFQYAEDIVQETMLRAWRRHEPLDSTRAGAWLYTVAHNLVVSGHRRWAARPAEVPLGERDFPQRADQFNQLLLTEQVIGAVRTLRKQHRVVLLRLFYGQQTISEAASELDIPLGTVKSRQFYALRALRRALEQQGVVGR